MAKGKSVPDQLGTAAAALAESGDSSKQLKSSSNKSKSQPPDQLSRAESSTLDKHDDPFAPRKGKALVWKNVNMTLVRIITLKHKDF